MDTKTRFISLLTIITVCSGGSFAFAKGGSGAGHSGGGTDKGIGTVERAEKKGIEGQEQGKHKGATKKKAKKASKGKIQRATPATPAVPTPGTPKATPAIPAAPSN